MLVQLRRAGRRTNVALLVLLVSASATGVVGYEVGTPGPSRVVALLHGVVGLGLLALVPWKQVIVRRSLRRRTARSGRPDSRAAGRRSRSRVSRWMSIALAVLIALSVVAGVAHASFGPRTYFGVTALQVHVGAALLAVPLLLHHVLTWPQRPRRTDLSRRSALGALGLGGAAATLYLAMEGTAVLLRLPGRDRRATGSYEIGSGDPYAMPVTQWVSDPVPDLEPAGWRLLIRDRNGERPVPYAELAAGTDTVRAVLDCTGGWYAEQVWRGVRLDRMLTGLHPAAGIDVVSVTGYRRRLPAADAPSLLLATHAGDMPLSAGHGAPARLVAPGHRGFWWVKWVARIEVVDAPWWRQPPLPTQ
jgi:DMSO/TMAO reductase YedYZ molybdopterin-dependent catalytic subunit